DEAAHAGIDAIERRTAETADCAELLSALPPLAEILRYGQARRTDAAQLSALFARIVVSGALALPMAARGLDAEAAAGLRAAPGGAEGAVAWIGRGEDETAAWRGALATVIEDAAATPLIAGVAARLNYEAEALGPQDCANLLGRMLSPGRPAAE